MKQFIQARPQAVERAPARAEITAWALLLGLSLLARVAHPGSPPLDPNEGRRALEALQLWRDGTVVYAAGPALTNVQSLILALFTAGDGPARLLSAVAGTALVSVPFLLRPMLGPAVAWWSGLGLALCPILVVASRSVSPAIVVALCLLLVAACAARFAREQSGHWLAATLCAVLVGFGVDPSFTVGLLGLVLATSLAEGDLLVRPSWWSALRSKLPMGIAVGLVVALLVDTRLLMNPIGLQAGLIDPMWVWAQDAVRGAGLVAPLLILLADGGLLVLAVLGVAEYRSDERGTRLLATWLLVSLALTALMRQPDLRYLILPLLPATLLAGRALAQIGKTIREHATTRSTIIALAAFVPLVTAGLQVTWGLRVGQEPWTSATIVALAGLLFIALVAFTWLRAPEMGAVLATFAAILCLVWTVTSASRLLEARGSDRAHLLQLAVITDEMNVVRREALKWYRANPSGPIPVDPQLRPIVGWALRDIPTVRYDTSLLREPVPRLLGDSVAPDPDFRTTRLVVGYAADWSTLNVSPARVWRWVVGRQSLVDIRPYAILVSQPAGT